MYPAPFRYHRPSSLQEAINLLAELGESARPLAGGQTLIPMMKMRVGEQSDLVDIARLPDLSAIDKKGDYVEIGALATHHRIAYSEIAELIPIVRDCAGGIADFQVRSRGTIGGSVSTADPSCDWPNLLRTLDAEINCTGPNGKRTVTIGDFVRDSYTTVLQPGELVTSIRFKMPEANSGGAYMAYKRAAPAYPVASAGVQITLADGDMCKDVRLVLGAAGPCAVVSEEAQNLLRGKALTPELWEQAADAIVEKTSPPADVRGSVAFKKNMLRGLLLQAAERAVSRARGESIVGSHNYV